MLVAGAVGAWLLLRAGDTARLRRENEELLLQRRQLQQAVEHLTGEERLAEIHVLDQVQPGELVNGRPADSAVTTLEFIEIDRRGHTLPARRFVIHDDLIFFDALVLKFDQRRVAAGDALRGKSLALFRRVYGEHQNPADGFCVDPVGQVPDLYKTGGQCGEFEQKLWSRFWEYATNPESAEKEGVRIAQGEAVYVPMRKNDSWMLTLQNNGGLNLKLNRAGDRGPMKLHNAPPPADFKKG